MVDSNVAMVDPGAGTESSERAARLATIFTENYRLAWRILRRFGVEQTAVEDATQQVFLIVAERLPDIRVGAERSFVYGTALRLASSHRRRRGREVGADDMDVHASIAPTPADTMERNRALELLDAALNQMPDDLRRVFVLSDVEEMTTPEVAALEQIPVGTAASRLRRARAAFRKFVATREGVLRRKYD